MAERSDEPAAQAVQASREQGNKLGNRPAGGRQGTAQAQLRPGRGRRLVVLLATLAGVAITVSMGRWQLSRAEQKQALQRVMDERAGLPPLPQAQLARTADAAQAQLQRRVVLTGRWVGRHTVFLDNRQMDGRPGFFVVTPLELAPGEAVLVQRGWLPRDARERTRLPAVPAPGGAVTVVGRVVGPPSRLFDFGKGDEGSQEGTRVPIRQNLDPAAFARETGLKLRPLSVQQLAAPVPDDGLQRRWPAPALDVGRHHGYALQWFAMAAVMAGLYVWFQLVRPAFRAR